jgi:hypothetical protein
MTQNPIRNFEFFKVNDGRIAKFGRSNKARLQESFKNSNSPATIPNFSNIIALNYQLNLDGSSEGNSNLRSTKDLSYSKSLYNFNSIKMNYNDAPDWQAIKDELIAEGNGSGNPESPWAPNVNSPLPLLSPEGDTVTSINPIDIPRTEEDDIKGPSNTPFVGEGHVLSPFNSSSKIARQNLFFKKTFGRSS